MLVNYYSRQTSSVNSPKASSGSNLPKLPDEVINADQFAQIIDAILDGKYSWACVLLLYWSNYNPLHYIPYRTFNRLIKENLQENKDLIKERRAKQNKQKLRDTVEIGSKA